MIDVWYCIFYQFFTLLQSITLLTFHRNFGIKDLLLMFSSHHVDYLVYVYNRASIKTWTCWSSGMGHASGFPGTGSPLLGILYPENRKKNFNICYTDMIHWLCLFWGRNFKKIDFSFSIKPSNKQNKYCSNESQEIEKW